MTETSASHGAPPAPPVSGSVALVHDWLTGMRGGEKVLEEMAALFPEAPIYTLFHFPGSVSAHLESHPIHTSFLQRAPALRRHYRRYLPLFPAAIESLDLSGYDLVLSTSHCVAKGIVPGPDARHVSYCHTPMRYAWDQEAAYFPQRRGAVARLRGAVLTALRTWDVASSARVDRFLANSSFVARRIERYYRRAAEVLAPPVDTEFFTPGEEPLPSAPFALAVAALAPYKRLELAAAAAARVGLRLVVVGEGPERPRLERLSTTPIELLGRVDRETLRRLYRTASCFVQPGVEDFGIAAVESLACGTPVVALARGGVLDIVEPGRHGWLYPPPRPGEDPAEPLCRALDIAGRESLDRMALKARAEQFSRRRFRERLAAVLGTAVESGDARRPTSGEPPAGRPSSASDLMGGGAP